MARSLWICLRRAGPAVGGETRRRLRKTGRPKTRREGGQEGGRGRGTGESQWKGAWEGSQTFLNGTGLLVFFSSPPYNCCQDVVKTIEGCRIDTQTVLNGRSEC